MPPSCSYKAPAAHPAGPVDGILSDLLGHPTWGGGRDIGPGLDLAHWRTWAPLDNTGTWREGCPSLSLSVYPLDPTG